VHVLLSAVFDWRDACFWSSYVQASHDMVLAVMLLTHLLLLLLLPSVHAAG
jgi:hypothetical protein